MCEIVREGVVVVTDGKGEWYAPPISDIPDGAYEVRSVWKPLAGASIPESQNDALLQTAKRALVHWLHCDETAIRKRLRKYLDGTIVRDHESSGKDARAILEQWIDDAFVAGFHAGSDRLATATELLRELEWEGDGMGARCPECRVAFRTHAPDCKLAAFLEGCRNDNPEAKA